MFTLCMMSNSRWTLSTIAPRISWVWLTSTSRQQSIASFLDRSQGSIQCAVMPKTIDYEQTSNQQQWQQSWFQKTNGWGPIEMHESAPLEWTLWFFDMWGKEQRHFLYIHTKHGTFVNTSGMQASYPQQ